MEVVVIQSPGDIPSLQLREMMFKALFAAHVVRALTSSWNHLVLL